MRVRQDVVVERTVSSVEKKASISSTDVLPNSSTDEFQSTDSYAGYAASGADNASSGTYDALVLIYYSFCR